MSKPQSQEEARRQLEERFGPIKWYEPLDVDAFHDFHYFTVEQGWRVPKGGVQWKLGDTPCTFVSQFTFKPDE